MLSDAPVNLCECGCLQPTKLRKGKPNRFIYGHYQSGGRPDYSPEDRGYDTPCWIWQKFTNEWGYGVKRLPTVSSYLAHRVYYEIYVGPIPDGLTIDHLCRVRECVNPAHLEAVPKAVNTLRGNSPSAVAARKTHCKHGHPLSGDNLYRPERGIRECLTCRREREKARYEAVKAARGSG